MMLVWLRIDCVGLVVEDDRWRYSYKAGSQKASNIISKRESVNEVEVK